MGLVPDNDSRVALHNKHKKGGYAAIQNIPEFVQIPEKFSLQSYCPPIIEQSSGTCFSVASAYAARSILFSYSRHDTTDKFRKDSAFSCGFITYLVKHERSFHKLLGTPCANGADITQACEKMENVGCVFKIDYDYECSNYKPDQKMMVNAANYKIKTSDELFPDDADSAKRIESIQQELTLGRPVIIAVNSQNSFGHPGMDGQESWIPKPDEVADLDGKKSNHAICVVAFDNAKNGGSFQVMNSWGSRWGIDGFAWIRYVDFYKFCSYALSLKNPDDQRP